MTERSRTTFARLFEVRILHHYWLDQGATAFGSIADANLATTRLLTYDTRRFLRVEPSEATATIVAGLRGVFRQTGLGFLVGVPDDVVIPLDATFEFHVTATAADYAGYTALSLRSRQIVDVVDPATGDVHRYKANVPLLSNATGVSRGAGANRRLYLSTEYVGGAGNGDAVEAIVTSGNNVRQLTGDPPGAPFHVLGARGAVPVYLHQGDARPITPPAGSVGAPARGVELTGDMPPTVTAVIRLVPRRATDDHFSFANADGTVRTPPTVYELHLRNRWTTRRYRDPRDGSVVDTDVDPTPLTHFGNAGPKHKPPPDAIDVELDNSNPPKITRLISDIYV